MAKFCTKCGSEMVDGKCPKCKETKKTTNENQIEEVDIKQGFTDSLEILKGIFTKPFDIIKKFVCENKYIAGIIMIVLTALSQGLYKIATLKNMYSSNNANAFNSNDFSDLLDKAMQGNLGVKEPEYLKEFMTSFATNLVLYAVLAVAGYFLITKLFKGKATIKEMLSVVGVSLAVVLVANVANSVFVFIDAEVMGYIRSYITSFATITSTLVLSASVNQVAKIDKNKLFLSVASMSVLATLVIDIVEKLFD